MGKRKKTSIIDVEKETTWEYGKRHDKTQVIQQLPPIGTKIIVETRVVNNKTIIDDYYIPCVLDEHRHPRVLTVQDYTFGAQNVLHPRNKMLCTFKTGHTEGRISFTTREIACGVTRVLMAEGANYDN